MPNPYKIDENVQREIIKHRSLRHPNIIKFKEVASRTLSVVLPQEENTSTKGIQSKLYASASFRHKTLSQVLF
ncbi:hypothetical protein K1719_021432 [Acacia pycnantha]|nr:hypothetical protein K1719_021432 [Acacia pycnantha]